MTGFLHNIQSMLVLSMLITGGVVLVIMSICQSLAGWGFMFRDGTGPAV